ncbi:primary-amine oxidase [Fusarium sporotrichioides]|uniref:Amine oxidase n=1 Tax=Fusarium sporotrichioides TaxID=5514 RepID=A0A395RRH9_FUSSP|nr:primary-amine oxidase [Fusarium sporotrichioides]
MAAALIHLFDPLRPDEISKVDPNFRVITLLEPATKQTIPYLEKDHHKQLAEHIPIRYAPVEASIKGGAGENQLFELIVDLDDNKVAQKQHVKGKHSYIDSNYMKQVETACLANEKVQAEIRTLDLPATVVVKPWAYATDGMNDMTERVTMEIPTTTTMPIPSTSVLKSQTALKVTKVYRLPTMPHERINTAQKPLDRRRIHSTAASQYNLDLRPSPRTTTKPYQVVRPDGPSLQIQGNHLEWEKCDLRVVFNYGEGLTLHYIRYDGRSLFYRLSPADMFVLYGDPRAPYPRKAAFDLGNDGADVNANNPQLGCDCLGIIKYLSAYHNTSSKEPMELPNVVCCHEQGDGILWKYTNFRTNTPVVTRSRILVLQTIIVDASIFNEGKYLYGTNVSPGVLAPYHQHLFSLRIDPAVDGHANSLVVEESKPLPIDDPSVHNPFDVGYISENKFIEEEGGFGLDHTKARAFKFVNGNKTYPITGTPVGFKLIPAYSQMLLSHHDSFHAKRSEFAEYTVSVTRHEGNYHFPAGKYTMQSSGVDGLASVIAKRRNTGTAQSVRNQDVVIWHTLGTTHNPRTEDWPVIPNEKMMVCLKPVNFFSDNSGLDVAPSTQEKNKSVLYTGGDEKALSYCNSKL